MSISVVSPCWQEENAVSKVEANLICSAGLMRLSTESAPVITKLLNN